MAVTPTKIMKRKRGGKGGMRLSPHLNFLHRLVESAEMTPEAVHEAITFVRRVIADDSVSERDRNNAVKTLASLTKTQADVALSLHKDDRIDGGQATEVYNVVIPGVKDVEDD